LRKKQYNNEKGIDGNKGQEVHLRWQDARIIEELLSDAYISSTYVSKKHGIPLSTVQRRRRYLENTILIRRYEINHKKQNFRIGEITVFPKRSSKEIAEKILSRYRKNVIYISVKVDGSVILTVLTYFKTTNEIHDMMEGISSISSVAQVKFAETVEVIRAKTDGIDKRLLQSS
jgi:DNA-binding Lrp family transcriptional regulator